MPRPLLRLAHPRLWVGDTGPLMQEVVQALRLGALTSLLAALHHDSARLYVARHVLVEIERDLPRYALDRGADPAAALVWWKRFYLPYITVIDVPASWGGEDPRVKAVANRHPVDLPTAQLAAALAPCHGLIEDPDLADNGFGCRPGIPKQSQSAWLQLAHGSANQAEMDLAGSVVYLPSTLTLELARGAGRAFRRLPDGVQLTLLLAGLIGMYWWQSSERAKQQMGRARVMIKKVSDVVVPFVAVVLDREEQARAAWKNNTVSRGPVSLDEQIARRLAFADDPMTAAELASAIDRPGTLRDHATVIRSQLRSSSAYIETSRGRWRLGEPASDQEPGVGPADVADWLKRSHRSHWPQRG